MPKTKSHRPSVQKYWQDYQKKWWEEQEDLSFEIRTVHTLEMICDAMPIIYGTYFFSTNAARINRKFRGGRKNRNL